MTGYCSRWLNSPPGLLDPSGLLSLSSRFPDQFPFLLESSATGPLGRHSLLLFAGEEELRVDPITGLHGPGQGDSFFARLESWYQSAKIDADGATSIPFIGGWFLYLGYEISAEIEPGLELPLQYPDGHSGAEPGGQFGWQAAWPGAFARRCPAAIIVYHRPEGDCALVIAENETTLIEVIQYTMEWPSAGPSAVASGAPVRLVEVRQEPGEIFCGSVERILSYLAAGDVFQVNISRPWAGHFDGSVRPEILLESMRLNNPAPFSGLVRRGEFALLSSSPERLIEIRQRQVQTRPIAGTRPRAQSAEEDAALHRELIRNPKERAEHIMLIDLERNDLGRVCEPGSIKMDEFMVIESYAHVHHIVSNVSGSLRGGASPVEAIRAVFPGGTITGCPKVRCMEIIAELESRPRGFYSGSMGYLGRDGQLDLNILIRSLLLKGSQFSFSCGAGIVADSNPERELVETEEKAKGLLLSLQSVGQAGAG